METANTWICQQKITAGAIQMVNINYHDSAVIEWHAINFFFESISIWVIMKSWSRHRVSNFKSLDLSLPHSQINCCFILIDFSFSSNGKIIESISIKRWIWFIYQMKNQWNSGWTACCKSTNSCKYFSCHFLSSYSIIFFNIFLSISFKCN